MKHFSLTALLSSLILVTACSGGDSPATDPSPVQQKKTTQIENLSLSTDLVRGQESKVVFECANCNKDKATYKWEIGSSVVSKTISFVPDFEHLNSAISITVQVPSTDDVLSEPVTISKDLVARTTTITDLSFDSVFVREQETAVSIECENCIKEDAIYLWVVEGVEVSHTNSFIPDFEHLDTSVSVTVRVPSIDKVFSDDKSIENEIVSRKTQVDTLKLSGMHTPNSSTKAIFTCKNCLTETISMQWLIDDNVIAEGVSFSPSLENFDKKITIKAQVESIDKIPSEIVSKNFIKPIPLTGKAMGSEVFVLMSNGELIFNSNDQQNNRPEEGKKDFINAFYQKVVSGIVLAEDSNGKYYEYGDAYPFNSVHKESTFEDVAHKISDVVEFWQDDFGFHVLTADGKVITWYNTRSDSGNFEFSKTQMSQPELSDVKQVLHSLYDCSSNDNTSAVLYDNGLLVVDGFWGRGFEYTRFEKTGVSKIQAVSYDGGASFDAIAMFDKDNNVEIWTCDDTPFFHTQENGIYATGYGDLTDVKRIISPPNSKAILAIKHDGSFALRGAGLLYNISSLNTNVQVKDLLYMSWLLVMLDEEGNVHYLDDYWANHFTDKHPNFSFDNLAYSVRSDHSNGVIVKEDGSALLITQKNPQALDSVKRVDLVSNFMLVTDENDKLSTYYDHDSERKLEPKHFSNNKNQIEQVHNIFNVGEGHIIQTKLGEFVLVHGGISYMSSYHEKLNRPIEHFD